LHLGHGADHGRFVAELDDVLFVGVGETFESCASMLVGTHIRGARIE
jgi:hypothetical protein